MIREFEKEEAKAAEDLNEIRTTLATLRKRLATAESSEAAEANEPSETAAAQPSSAVVKGAFSVIRKAILAQDAPLADYIDMVLDSTPINAKDLAARIRALPNPPDFIDATIRWNLTNKHKERGWIRGGTKARAFWTKVATKEAANA